jgi:hypothetical protein
MEIKDGAAVKGDEEGDTPRKNPKETNAAAASTILDGLEPVDIEEIIIVRGNWRPLAIWKKEASTERRHSVLKIRPIAFTKMTGTSFLNTSMSISGISTREENIADTWRRITARTSWMKR